MVPNGWSLVEANEVCCSISVGVVIKPSQYYVSKEKGIRAFRSANVREGFINDSDWVYFSEEGHNANKKSQLKTGDVLIVRTGYPGTACVVTPEFDGANAIDIVIARPDINKILPEFLCAYTNSSVGKSQVLNLQGGMAQKHLNVGAYQVLKIKLPPKAEQQKIAKILSTWDKAISVTEQLISKLQQQKKILAILLITPNDASGVYKEWNATAFGNVAHLGKKRFNPKIDNGHMECIELEHISQETSILLGSTTTEIAISTKSVFMPGNVLFGKLRPYLRKYWFADRNGVCSTEIWVLIANEEKITPRYLHQLVQMDFFIDAANMASGTHMPRADWDVVKNIPITLPPLQEQQKIAQVLTAADREIELYQQKLAGLKQEKQALMQQLLTGKRRVVV
jgi:type I restriction enzyme S subunit